MRKPAVTRPPGQKPAGRRTTKPLTAKQLAEQRKAEDEARMAELYGDDLADVRLLQRRGFGVTREGDGYRVGSALCTPAEMRAKAARERRLEKPAPETIRPTSETKKPASETIAPPFETQALKCPCGRPLPHYGRCWHRRGLAGPTVKATKRNAAPTVSAGAGPIPRSPAAVTKEGDRSGTTKIAAQLREQIPASTDRPRLEREAAAIESCGVSSDGVNSAVSPGPRKPLAGGPELRAEPVIANNSRISGIASREVSREPNGPAEVAPGPHDLITELAAYRSDLRANTAALHRLADALGAA